jgi:hypothetical protein
MEDAASAVAAVWLGEGLPLGGKAAAAAAAEVECMLSTLLLASQPLPRDS